MSEKAKEISRKLREKAKANDALVTTLKETARVSSLEIGWICREMKEQNQFPLLGFDTENEYRKAKKIGRSTWFRYIGLADKFKKLPKAEFLKLIAENADHLAKFEDKIRYNKDLIKKAQTLTEEEFEKHLVRHRSRAEDRDEDDVIVTWKLRLPEGVNKVRKRVFKKFAEQHEIPVDDEVKILELICAEIEHRQPVVTAMMRCTNRLGEISKLFTDAGNLSADEVLKKAGVSVDAVLRDMCMAAGIKPPEKHIEEMRKAKAEKKTEEESPAGSKPGPVAVEKVH